jgi:O-antigen/teichoic acid export membrane protein
MATERHDGLIRHSLLLLLAMQVGGACTALFLLVMGRALSPEQYGVLASMIGLIFVAAIPMDAIRAAFAHFVARLSSAGQAGDARALVRSWMAGITRLSLPLAVVAILFSGPLARFFLLEGRAPIVVVLLILSVSPYVPVLTGSLQGLQAFGWMAVHQHSWTAFRFLIGGALVLWVSPLAVWGLVGHLLAAFVSIGFGFIGLSRSASRAPVSGRPLPVLRPYFLRSLVVLAGFGVLMNADIILVKHFFPPHDAGLFARAATIGRAVIFLPLPIALAMFPKVASRGPVSAESRRLLFKALRLAGGIVLGGNLLCTAFPQVPLWILFGDRLPDAGMTRLVRAILWAISPLSLAYLMMSFDLARHRFRRALVTVPCAAAYVGAVWCWHASLLQVVAILAAASLGATILIGAGMPWKRAGG